MSDNPGDSELWRLIGGSREAVLATLGADGAPQLSNVLYVFDPDARIVRISTTAGRVKARNARRDPRAALHVAGDNFWAYAVAEGSVTLSDVAQDPGDAATAELLAVHSSFYGPQQADEFYAAMIADRRLVIRLHVQHVYGLIASGGRRPVGSADSEGSADSDVSGGSGV